MPFGNGPPSMSCFLLVSVSLETQPKRASSQGPLPRIRGIRPDLFGFEVLKFEGSPVLRGSMTMTRPTCDALDGTYLVYGAFG